MVEHLTTQGVCARSESKQYHLTAQGSSQFHEAAIRRITHRQDLPGYLSAFLIASKVNGLSPITLKGYGYMIGKFVSFCLDLDLTYPAEITADDVRLFILKLQETNSSQSVHDYYRPIKRFFNWLVEEDILKTSPMLKIRAPKIEKKVIVPFTADHLRTLIKLCNPATFCGLRNRAMIMILVDTAIRKKELLSMNIEDIDFTRGIIKVHGKGARERIVAIEQRTQKILPQYLLNRKDDHACVWVTEERKPFSYDGLSVTFRVIAKRAGFKDVRCSPHTFRHTSATMCLNNGARELEVQAMLGHSTLTMTRRYVATLNSEKAAEAHKLFSLVEHLKLE